MKLDEQDSIVPNFTLTLPKTIIELSTKTYVDSLLENSSLHLSSAFNDQDNELDKIKLISLVSITVNRSPFLDNELLNIKFVDDELDRNTRLGFYQTLGNFLKVSVKNNVYNLTN